MGAGFLVPAWGDFGLWSLSVLLSMSRDSPVHRGLSSRPHNRVRFVPGSRRAAPRVMLGASYPTWPSRTVQGRYVPTLMYVVALHAAATASQQFRFHMRLGVGKIAASYLGGSATTPVRLTPPLSAIPLPLAAPPWPPLTRPVSGPSERPRLCQRHPILLFVMAAGGG